MNVDGVESVVRASFPPLCHPAVTSPVCVSDEQVGPPVTGLVTKMEGRYLYIERNNQLPRVPAFCRRANEASAQTAGRGQFPPWRLAALSSCSIVPYANSHHVDASILTGNVAG